MFSAAPVRIDLAGGWSDTPPLTFEAPVVTDLPFSTHPVAASLRAHGGGAVVNVAVQVVLELPLQFCALLF